jgi:peroxiredoxin
MIRFVLLPILLFFATAQARAQQQQLVKPGMWTGVLKLNDSTDLPIAFVIKEEKDKTVLEIMNGSERIVATDVSLSNDSLNFHMPVFDSEFRCKNYFGSLKGVWINRTRVKPQSIPFTAKQGFAPVAAATGSVDFSGKWEVTFSPGLADSSKAIGLFQAEGTKLSGTFLTESGDYRYLHGAAKGAMMQVSCFDGAHAYVFQAKLNKSGLQGDFYSGTSGHEKWIGVRNNSFELHNPDSLTFLKKDAAALQFTFRNSEGVEVSLRDKRYANKVVLIQIMGTWCPNCMDETKFLAAEYERDKSKGLEIIALAFERTSDTARANANLRRLKLRYHAGYEFLLTGKTGNQQASEVLPMLNAVMAFPTTLYIDKKGRIRKIYTGFNGPATGNYFDQYKEEHERFLDKLLAE